MAKKNNLVSSKKLPCEMIPQGEGGLPPATILAPNISARDISTQTFHHRDISAHAGFDPVGVPAHGHFVSVDVLVQGLFGTGIFRHSSTGAQMSVPKCPCAETSMLPKNPCAKKSPCRKVLVPKRPRRRNVHVLTKHLQGRNVHVPKCLWPKC